jgi:hypothetical protein
MLDITSIWQSQSRKVQRVKVHRGQFRRTRKFQKPQKIRQLQRNNVKCMILNNLVGHKTNRKLKFSMIQLFLFKKSYYKIAMKLD